MVSHGFPSRRFPPSSSVNLIPSVSCSFRAAGGAMCSFRAAGGAMCAFRAAGGAMCAFRAAGGAMCAFRAAGGAMCAFRAAGGAMCAFRAAGGAMCSFRAAGGAMCAFRAAGGEMCLFRAAGGAMCLFRAAGGAICSFRAAGGAMCSFRAAGGAMCTFRAAGGAMCAFRAAGGAMCSFRAACGAMCAFRAAGAACCFFPDSRPFLPLYEERMTVAPPPASQPITDGHVAGQVGNGAARREARGLPDLASTSDEVRLGSGLDEARPVQCASTHLCSPALTSAPLRSPLLPCAHLCSPALTSAPLRSPLLPCTHLCSPALTSAPLHSPLLPCTHLYCSPTFHTTVSPSPTVHAIVSPSPNVHTTVSPSPVVHTTVFSPLFTHLLFPLFPLFTPLPSPLARHAPRTHLLCSLPSPHSLIARNIQPGLPDLASTSDEVRLGSGLDEARPVQCASTHLCSPALTSAPLRSPLLPCAHLCSPALTSAPLRSPLLPCAHLCSPALTSAPLHSSLLPCAHLCSPAVTSAPLRSPLLPCAHLCSPALTSAPLRSPLLPCAHLCSPALTSAPLHSPLLPCTHLCSPALTFTVHPLFTPPFPLSPTVHAIVSPSPTVHAIVSPSRNVHTTVSPSPVVHTTVFSPLFTHLLFPLFPLFTPLPSPLARHAPRTHLLCSLPPLTHCPKQPASTPCLLFGEGGGGRGAHREGWVHKEAVWEREVEHVSGGELQRFAVGVVGGQLGDRHLHVWEREVEHLSGGELQRFAIGVVAGQLGDIYMFDEPSSYLDVRQRLKAAQVIRSLLRPDRYVIVVERDLSVLDYLSHFIYVIVVEHDLSVLDYLSDFICCLYGKPGAYGVVTLPFSVREGINIFLAGFVPTENLRFRDESLTFRVSLPIQSAVRGGINIFLAGFVLTENLRFRDEPLTFRGTKTLVDNPEEGGQDVQSVRYRYLGMIKKHGGFNLLLPLPHSILSPPFIPSQVAETPVDNPEEAKTYTRYKYPRMIKKQGGSQDVHALQVPAHGQEAGPVQAPPSPPPLSIPSQVAETPVDNPEEAKTYTRYKYPRMVKKQGGFKLTVEPGDFTDSQIVVMLGENGTGKTTFIRMLVGKLSLMGAHAACTSLWLSLLPVPSMIHLPSLLSPFQAALSRPDPDEETGKEAQGWSAGLLKADPDEETGKEAEDLPEFNVSFKPQKISRKFPLSYPLADPDEETGKEAEDLPEFNVSYKPQKISPKFPHSVRALLHSKIRDSFHHPQFNTDVLRPMQIDPLLDQEVVNLSGGELQRVAITLCLGKIDPLLDQEVVKISGGELQRVAITLCLGKIDPLLDQEVVNLSGGELQRVAISLCLGKPADIYLIDEPSAYLDSEQRIVAAKPADIYLIDEPSAYLDSEQRIVAAKVIKRFILHAKKTAFVVEHDFIMATYLADRVIVYEGQPSVDCTARTPQSLNSGMNLFLSPSVDCTARTPQSLNSGMNLFLSTPPFVVEHDFIMATYLADRVIVYEGQPSVDCTARTPQSLNSGMNLFLSQLDITFRRDPTNFRPRINKMDSVKDREQKNVGTYYYLDD
ncbi:unnamed protein product [Closterium sp. NIES-64]|nr:unnamed protein product [Closterium sp. NIES-64]